MAGYDKKRRYPLYHAFDYCLTDTCVRLLWEEEPNPRKLVPIPQLRPMLSDLGTVHQQPIADIIT